MLPGTQNIATNAGGVEFRFQTNDSSIFGQALFVGLRA